MTSGHRQASTQWLTVAVMTTALVGVLVLVAFSVMLGRVRADSTGAAVATSVPPDAFIISFTRLTGGPLEWSTYSALTVRIGEALGVPVAIRFVKDVDESRMLFQAGELDAAFVSIYGYLQASDDCLVDLVATPVIGGNGREASVVVVRSDSAFTDLEDTRGSRLVATEPPSIGGYGFIAWLLAQDDETPESFFGSVERVVSHEQSLRLLHARAADVACVNRSQLASWSSDSFRVIATSPEFGMPPLVVSRSVDAATKERLRTAVLGFDVGSDPSAKGSQIDRFAYTAPEAYGFARAVIDFMADDGSGSVGVTHDE